MKKLILVLAALLAFNAAYAQFYAGGVAGFSLNNNGYTDKSSFSLTLDPEFGYSFSDSFGVGAQLILNLSNRPIIGISPYLRYTFAKLGPVAMFADAAFTYEYYTGDNPYSTWEVGLYPGIAIPVNDKVSFVGHFGNLSYDSFKNFNIGAFTGANVGIFLNL